MSNIYIAFVDTPGFFAGIIRTVLKQKYIHVVISMDERLEEAYSIGRRNPQVPFFAGFEREDKNSILEKFPDADYMVCSVSCSETQREQVRAILHHAYAQRYRYHYTILGLPLILFQIPFRQKFSHTCSSYLAKVLEMTGIWQWKKDTSIVTPKDFYEDMDKKIIYEGPLYNLIDQPVFDPSVWTQPSLLEKMWGVVRTL